MRANNFILILVLVFVFARPVKADGVKIAIVDLYRIVSETEDGKKAKSELESYFNKKQKSLDQKSEELKVKMENLKKKQKMMSSDDYQDEVDELQAEIVELQNTYVKYQKAVAKKEMDLTEPILAKLEKILDKIGKEQGYTVILKKEAVAWAPDAKEITDQVIKMYNAEPPADFSKVKDDETKKDTGGKDMKKKNK